MVHSIQSLGIDRMSVDERLELIKAICDSMAPATTDSFRDAWREEILRRSVEAETNPGEMIPFDQVEAEALARLGP